ncbi:MAG TPA: nucleotidyl transferase AbiEii/AbiGii toxin family protein [Planctomycetota bacterium]|nr:nucleotidyl transferase AbiEii/AbiGii toxin family protein [Planctomycetota bacterium]
MQREHLGLLADVARAFTARRIVAIGAAALRWHYTTFRGTLDLDLCIAIDLDEHSRADALPTEWRRKRGMPHRWHLPDGQLLDIVPAADDLLAAGVVNWPDGTAMDLCGIDLAMRDNQRYADELPAEVRVASRRALFVTKVAAWLDRPHDRHKDLGDIARLCDEYVDDADPRRFDEPALEGRDWDERPTFLLGMDLAAVCSARHGSRIREFAARIGDPARLEHVWMLGAAPTAWQADPTAVSRRMQALLDGFGH